MRKAAMAFGAVLLGVFCVIGNVETASNPKGTCVRILLEAGKNIRGLFADIRAESALMESDIDEMLREPRTDAERVQLNAAKERLQRVSFVAIDALARLDETPVPLKKKALEKASEWDCFRTGYYLDHLLDETLLAVNLLLMPIEEARPQLRRALLPKEWSF